MTNEQPESFLFEQRQVPVFQNKTYDTCERAQKAELGDVFLVQDLKTGLVHNKKFDPRKLAYDRDYQNEQGHSTFFQNHLSEVVALLKGLNIQKQKVVEIGCGKGLFLELLEQNGINCLGFDPAYEGSKSNIVKDYFSSAHQSINAEFIVLRHTLEHVPNPLNFLHAIAEANRYRGRIYIEVPTFDWILKKGAFWDVFYEHCNYFTQNSLTAMFGESQFGPLFEGQYIYIVADLNKLRRLDQIQNDPEVIHPPLFPNEIQRLKAQIYTPEKKAIWGAAAKGSTFLNLLDKKAALIEYAIDINPAKQNRFVAGTGHAIFSPSILNSRPVEKIIVMNENYLGEIKRQIGEQPIALECI